MRSSAFHKTVCPIPRAFASRDEWVRPWVLPLLLLFFALPAQAQLPPEPMTVRIGVLSLFHPRTLLLSAAHPITLRLDGAVRILDANHPATLQSTPEGLLVDEVPTPILTIQPETFTLTVPGKLSRTYRGALTVTARQSVLVAVIAMDTEVAVASIVAAESPPHAPLEALKAQAIASRSFLLAHPGTHREFDACDTTHCQFLRSPPPAVSPAADATRATSHAVLTWRGSADSPARIVPAMYSRSCGGQTRVPGKIADADAYPFYSVACAYCRRHPELWTRPAGTPAPATEQQRLAWNRTHGWEAIPSNTHTASGGSLEGRGIGHGVGLCQLGAADLAARGAAFPAILSHYFPGTILSTLP
jgi:stage II sporulation protein D